MNCTMCRTNRYPLPVSSSSSASIFNANLCCIVRGRRGKCALSVYDVDMLHQLKVIHSCEYCMTLPESRLHLVEAWQGACDNFQFVI